MKRGKLYKGNASKVETGKKYSLDEAFEILDKFENRKFDESIDIAIRFPVFQLEKPVNQWTYNFALADFKQAVRRIDEDCAPARLVDLVEQKR